MSEINRKSKNKKGFRGKYLFTIIIMLFVWKKAQLLSWKFIVFLHVSFPWNRNISHEHVNVNKFFFVLDALVE